MALKVRLLLPTIMGLLLVAILAAAYYWQADKQNAVITRISSHDLQILDRYTDLFTDLSRLHMRLFELLYDAGRNVDEGEIYDRGRNLLDNISESTQKIRNLPHLESAAIDRASLASDSAKELVAQLTAYRNSSISAVEMTTVDLIHASDYLNKANQHFTHMHSAFAARLDQARSAIRSTAEEQVVNNRQRTTILALGGLLLALLVSMFGYLMTLRLSRRLQHQINTLNELSASQLGQESHSDSDPDDELTRMGSAIDFFRTSLGRLKEQENTLAEKNRDLEDEIQVRFERD